MGELLIYGATGYTGAMAAEHARDLGLNPVVGGRNVDKVVTLAERLDCNYAVFGLGDQAAVDEALATTKVLLNCAGPYLRTARPLMEAAIRTGTHYLDIAAELDSYRLAGALDDAATAAGVMLMPGCGGSVAMLGCLAAHIVARVQAPQRLWIALHVAGSMSRGSAISASENLTTETLHRVDGTLVAAEPSAVREFDFGFGDVACIPVTLPDLITIGQATGIANIDTYVYASGDAFPDGALADLPDGPSAEQRAADRYHAVAEVTGGDGQTVRSVLDTVNGYTFTRLAAAQAARRVLAGQVRPAPQRSSASGSPRPSQTPTSPTADHTQETDHGCSEWVLHRGADRRGDAHHRPIGGGRRLRQPHRLRLRPARRADCRRARIPRHHPRSRGFHPVVWQRKALSCRSIRKHGDPLMNNDNAPTLEVSMVTFDCTDPESLAAWWAGALDGQVTVAAAGEFVMVMVATGLRLGFQKVPDPTPGKNRVHLDLHSQDKDSDAARLIAAGAAELGRHSAGPDFGWVVLADPDGNVFCVAGAP